MKTLYAIVALTLLVGACSGQNQTTGITPINEGGSGGRASLLAAVPPNSEFPGTGTNPGLGAPNSCPTDKPTITKNQDGYLLKFTANRMGRVEPQFRGYDWELSYIDKGKTPKTLYGRTNRDDGMDGREFVVDTRTLDSGPWTIRTHSRRWACVPEFGEWSNVIQFNGNDVNSSTGMSRGGIYYED